MAGGVGSRFWPKSRNSFPKQFIDILGTGESLLQLTYKRFLKVCPASNIYILTNKNYATLVNEQLQIDPGNIVTEPSRNNTAPCIAYASAKINAINKDANVVVAPSDHLILKEDIFLEKIRLALSYSSEHDALLTLGISPSRADTGYGYIKYAKNNTEIKKVVAFLEKPELESAKSYVASGDYLWNAGIFIWSIKSIRKALKLHTSSVFDLFEKGSAYYGTENEKQFVEENYPLAENISIDFALMEKANNVFTIPADIGWSDLGTWASLYDISKEANSNSINTSRFDLQETTNCIISVNDNKAVMIKGLNDFIVVDDDRVLLIYPKKEEQSIKQASSRFIEKFGNQFS